MLATILDHGPLRPRSSAMKCQTLAASLFLPDRAAGPARRRRRADRPADAAAATGRDRSMPTLHADRRPGHRREAGLRPAVRQPLRLPPAPLDDALSADIYKRYLEALDGGKLFFTAQDIAKFDAYKLQARRRDQERRARSGLRDLRHLQAARRRARRLRAQAAQAGHLRLHRHATAANTTARTRRGRPTTPSSTTLWKQSREERLAAPEAGRQEARGHPQDARQALRQHRPSASPSCNGEDVFQTFINSYANSIDPHTDYFTPRTAENFNMSMSLSLEGIGAVLQKQDDVVVIREIVPGGPAGKSAASSRPATASSAVGQGDERRDGGRDRLAHRRRRRPRSAAPRAPRCGWTSCRPKPASTAKPQPHRARARQGRAGGAGGEVEVIDHAGSQRRAGAAHRRDQAAGVLPGLRRPSPQRRATTLRPRATSPSC